MRQVIMREIEEAIRQEELEKAYQTNDDEVFEMMEYEEWLKTLPNQEEEDDIPDQMA